MAVLLSVPDDSLPDVLRAPLQAPEAVHAVAFEEDHCSVEVPPGETEAGAALTSTVGAGGGGGGGGGFAVTVTVTLRLMFPPVPVQASVNVLVAASGPTLSDPDTALAPVQAPLAWQDVAFAEVQVSVDD